MVDWIVANLLNKKHINEINLSIIYSLYSANKATIITKKTVTCECSWAKIDLSQIGNEYKCV